MAHGDAREEKRRGSWRMEWTASTLHTTSEHGVYSITTADAHTSAASSRLNWRPRRFKRTRPFRRKKNSGQSPVEMWWQTVTHGRGKWRRNWWMEWVVSTLHTTSEHGVSSITIADAHTSAVSSRLHWCPRRFKRKEEFWFLRVCHHVSNALYIGVDFSSLSQPECLASLRNAVLKSPCW